MTKTIIKREKDVNKRRKMKYKQGRQKEATWKPKKEKYTSK